MMIMTFRGRDAQTRKQAHALTVNQRLGTHPAPTDTSQHTKFTRTVLNVQDLDNTWNSNHAFINTNVMLFYVLQNLHTKFFEFMMTESRQTDYMVPVATFFGKENHCIMEPFICEISNKSSFRPCAYGCLPQPLNFSRSALCQSTWVAHTAGHVCRRCSLTIHKAGLVYNHFETVMTTHFQDKVIGKLSIILTIIIRVCPQLSISH